MARVLLCGRALSISRLVLHRGNIGGGVGHYLNDVAGLIIISYFWARQVLVSADIINYAALWKPGVLVCLARARQRIASKRYALREFILILGTARHAVKFRWRKQTRALSYRNNVAQAYDRYQKTSTRLQPDGHRAYHLSSLG